MHINKFVNKHRSLLIILLVAFLLRVIFFGIILHNFGERGFYPDNSEDSVQYLQMTKNFIDYNVFSLGKEHPLEPDFFRVPGYPFYISIFYRIVPAVWFVMIFQNILALMAVILIYKICILIFNKKFIAVSASILYAVEPAVIYWNNQLLSETLFTFLILLNVYIFIRNIMIKKQYLLPSALAIGALTAFANYTRPTAQFMLFIFMLFSIVGVKLSFKNISRHLMVLILIVVSFGVLSAPWIIRNKALFNMYDFSSSSSAIGFRKYLWMMHVNRGENTEKVAQLEFSQLKSETIKYIIKHPLSFLEVHLSNIPPLLLGDSYFTVATIIYPPLEKQRVITENWLMSWQELNTFLYNHKGVEAVLFFGGKIILLILNLFSLAGIIFWLFIFKKHRASMLFLSFIIYYFILATGVAGYSRFRQPINPYIFILFGAGIYWFYSSIKGSKLMINMQSFIAKGLKGLGCGKYPRCLSAKE